MTKNSNRESIFEALFRQAVIDNFYDQINSFSNDDSNISFNFSLNHQLKMTKLFYNEKRKQILHKTNIWIRRLVIIIFVVITILFSSLMFVPEARAIIVSTVIEWFDRYIRFTSNTPTSEKSSLEPSYIPGGFTEKNRFIDDIGMQIKYVNNENTVIKFSSSVINAQLTLDNENYDFEYRIINSSNIYLLKSLDNDKDNIIIWETEDYRYVIESLISIDELIDMAQSLFN